MLELLVVLLAACVALYAALALVAWRFGDRLMFPAPGPSYRRGSIEVLQSSVQMMRSSVQMAAEATSGTTI